MSNELIVNSTPKEDRIVLLKDKQIVEYHVESKSNAFKVGDLYLGVVRKVAPGLNAVFVDIGYKKDAFLHYQDLGPSFSSLNKFTKMVLSKKNIAYNLQDFKLQPEIDKFGKINQVFHRNNRVLVQVTKEPISSKGPRLSSEISLAGRYIVLVPFSDTISVSKKITSKEERQRLIRLVSSIKPKNFGVIVRTVAEGIEVAELDSDLRNLTNKWVNGMKVLRNAVPKDKIIGELDRTASILRDMLDENFDSIVVDNKSLYEEVTSYIGKIAPEHQKIIKLHNGRHKLFENLDIEKQLKSLFGKSVNLPDGGYLIIEHTEALHVVDVNSGNKSSSKGADQETTALNVNLAAAKEIARQLRIRDMGGIIIIDFIDMRRSDHKRQIYEFMKKELKTDRSKSTILPLTKFGLMQITRQRVRPEMNISTAETCPSCGGTGKISASILVSDTIESNLEHLITKQNEKKLELTLHPYLHAYFTKGLISRRMKWLFKYGRWIKLTQDSSLPLVNYVFTNSQGEDVEFNEG